MRKIVFSAVVALGLVTAPTVQAETTITPQQAQTLPSSFADLVERLLPSVVNISSTQRTRTPDDFPEMPQFPPGSPFEDFFEHFMERHGRGMPMTPPASLGSGFIVDAERGFIVTNNHVVKDADEVRVTLHDDTTLQAEVVGRDEKVDLAILKVETDAELVQVTFGESRDLRVGDWVLAIGNPFGLGSTVTAGIVSAESRDINAGPYDDFIQTDASINRGNSGGPMFNIRGEVIGINTAIFSPSGGSVGIGFAIPADMAKPVISQLIEYGRTRRGWMGVRIQSVTEDIAESLGLDRARGALVASVTPTGPAEKAGLQPGDIVLEFDGRRINEMRSLPRVVAETPIDKQVEIVYWRDGEEHRSGIAVGELEKAEEEGLITAGLRESSPSSRGTVIENLGLTLNPIDSQARQDYSIPADVDGVLITDVKSVSEAGEKGLLTGDVIVEINQQAVTDPEKAKDVINTAREAGRSSVLLLINREGDSRFIALRLRRR